MQHLFVMSFTKKYKLIDNIKNSERYIIDFCNIKEGLVNQKLFANNSFSLICLVLQLQ